MPSQSIEKLSPAQVQLFAYLIERVCADEWHKTIAHKSGVNEGHTLVPFAASYQQRVLKKKPSADSGFTDGQSTTDNETAIYWQIVQRMPVAAYFWDDALFMKAFASVDFDFLAFCNFYLSNSYKLAADVWGLSSEPISLDFRHAIQKSESQFSLSKKQKASPVDPERAGKHEIFTKYWSKAFADMKVANEERKNMKEIAGEELYWQILRNSPTYEDLPPVYKNGLDSLIAAIAVTVDNLLENEERFRRAERLKRKIPETWLIYSLKVVPNPTPFVKMAISLFTKKIPVFGVSLFQLFGSSLVGYSRTNAQKKSLASKIPKERAEMIDGILKNAKLDVLATPKVIKSTLAKRMGGDVSKEEIAYARFSIRLGEKKDFIDYLGEGSIQFEFLSKLSPSVMREFMKYLSLSTFVQKLFDLLQECLNALRANFEPTKDKAAMKKKIVKELIFSITKFTKMMYEVMHKMSKNVNTPKEPKTLTWLFDMLLNLVFELCDLPLEGLHGFHTTILSKLSQMSPEDQEDAMKFAEAIGQLSAQGVDERFWPKSAVVDSLTHVANDEIRKMVLGMNVLNTVDRIHKDKDLSSTLELNRK